MNEDHALLRSWTRPVSAADCSPISAVFDLWAMAVDRDRGRVTMRFTVPDGMRRRDGGPDGRALAAMLDCTVGFAAMAMLAPPETIVTATLRIEAIRSTRASVFDGHGTVVDRSDPTVFARGELRDDGGTLVALASTTLRLVRIGG